MSDNNISDETITMNGETYTRKEIIHRQITAQQMRDYYNRQYCHTGKKHFLKSAVIWAETVKQYAKVLGNL